jgi:hypothetical protein
MTRSELQAAAPERAAAAMGQPEALLTKFEKKPAITNQIDAIVAKGAERMAQATPDMRGLRPTEVDWLTTNELQQLHSLKLQLPSPGEERLAAQQRIAAKRAAPAPAPAPRGPQAINVIQSKAICGKF